MNEEKKKCMQGYLFIEECEHMNKLAAIRVAKGILRGDFVITKESKLERMEWYVKINADIMKQAYDYIKESAKIAGVEVLPEEWRGGL